MINLHCLRYAARLAPAIAAAMVAACRADEDPLVAPTYENVVGIYHLYLVNGGSLPFIAAADGVQRVEFISGSITLSADRTITDVLTFRVSRVDGTGTPSEIVTTETGTYTIDGLFIYALYNGQEAPVGIAYTNGQLTRNASSFRLSYRK